MNRREFQELARIRIRDVEALMKAQRYSAAYYLSGYVVECALKACISKKTKRFDFHDKNSNRLYTHNLSELLAIIPLTDELERATDGVKARWAIVKEWSESSRYGKVEGDRSQSIFASVSDPAEGVLTWLEHFW